MDKFDPETAYKPQENPFFDDGREIALLHHLSSLPNLRNNPQAIIDAIDAYGHNTAFLMNVGRNKGSIVTSLIASHCPRITVELGSYIGYSALLFGSAVRDACPGARFYSIERHPLFAAISMVVLELAGLLGNTVRVVLGSSAESLRRLSDEGCFEGEKIDLLFLDHWKPSYVTDLKLAEGLGLVSEGTVLAADNVVKPGNPPYLEYVRSSVAEKLARIAVRKASGGGNQDTPAPTKNDSPSFAAAVDSPEHTRLQHDVDTIVVQGNPLLVYESELVRSFDQTGHPDGVEITRCVEIVQEGRWYGGL